MRSFIDFCIMLIAYAVLWTEKLIVAVQLALRPAARAFARSVGLLCVDRRDFEQVFLQTAHAERRLHGNQSIHGQRSRHRAARHMRQYLRTAWPVYEKYMGLQQRPLAVMHNEVDAAGRALLWWRAK